LKFGIIWALFDTKNEKQYIKKQWKFQNFLWHSDLRFHSAYVQYAIGKAILFYSQLLLLVELNANGGAFISFKTY